MQRVGIPFLGQPMPANYGAAKTMSSADTKLNERYQKYLWLNDILTKAGYPTVLRGIVIAQAMFETGDFTSRLGKKGYNITGIKYTKNSPFQAGPDGVYARYTSYVNWAQDLKRILQFAPGRPWDAKDVDQYVARLKQNRYFESDPKLYLNGVGHYIRLNNEAIKWANAIGQQYKAGKGPAVVNTEGWTAADDAAVARQGKFNWNFETWSTEKKVLGVFGLLAGLVVLRNLTS